MESRFKSYTLSIMSTARLIQQLAMAIAIIDLNKPGPAQVGAISKAQK